ncbi:NO-inducible flavohemoprotein [Salinisphaera orenii]|uniref:NO-inducible flavohemoprotein n=1 Tax=Salinisphaera orenii TaxID=856731 RepID=UPI000DBE8959
MLTADQTAVIKQTVPVLQEHGATLTDHMYRRMFAENPEVQAYFNPAHQHSGGQQRALANAILAYAQHVDNPAALGDAVELIAQKHVSLTIEPEHYPIVGKHLLASIREVLGDAATDDVIDAWSAAYGELADIFIRREDRIYHDQEQSWGWSGFKDFVVSRREPASDNIVSLYLEPADGQPLATHQPGQYIAINVALPDGREIMRNYSLSNAPGTPYFRISVKREPAPDADAPDGVFSNYLHDELQPGDHVALTPPCGEFTLDLPADETKPVVFIAGGVGVTPLMSMLHATLERASARQPVVFIQGALNGAVQAFGDSLSALARQYDNLVTHVRYSDPTSADAGQSNHDSEGLIDANLIADAVGDREATYHFCGPAPMLRHVHGLLKNRGVADADMHYEFFGPAGTVA